MRTRTGRTETRSSAGRRERTTDKSAALNSQPVNNYGISACENAMRPSINLCPYCDIVLPLWVSGKAGRPINTHSLLGKASCVIFSMGICDASRFHISMPNTKCRVACISVSMILCLFIVIGSDSFLLSSGTLLFNGAILCWIMISRFCTSTF